MDSLKTIIMNTKFRFEFFRTDNFQYASIFAEDVDEAKTQVMNLGLSIGSTDRIRVTQEVETTYKTA